MRVTLLDTMGTDLTVVNAARVSFDKHSDCLDEKDTKLIKYLAKHNHWTPFGHCYATFRIKAPIFVARQLAKHQVGLVWNEVSRRYVDSEPEFWTASELRLKADNVKQGSSAETIRQVVELGGCTNGLDPFLSAQLIPVKTENLGDCETCNDNVYRNTYDVEDILDTVNTLCNEAYNYLLSVNVCPEQARAVLPQSMMTEWYWSGSLMAFARVCKLRLDPHSQQETREVAQQMSTLLAPVFPVSWEALMNGA